MADLKKAGMISGMSPLAILTGDELLEVSARQSDGSWKSFSILVNKIRTNQGLSAYEVAVKNGFIGTEQEWLESLNGKSAYQIAVELGFTGTEEEFIASLVGPSAYKVAVDGGFNGTEAEWLETLKGKSAYQIAQANGFQGTEAEYLQSLKGKSAYQIALELDPSIGTEADWLKTLIGPSAYDVAVDNGFVGDEAAFIKSLEGKSAYQIWVAQGNTGNEADFIASLKGADGTNGTNGTNGKSAYEIWEEQPGNEGKTEAEFIAAIKGEDGANGTNGTNGENGKSAYDIWVAQPGNAGKTEAEFIASLKGEDGTNGTNGTNGLSAYEVWLTLPGNEGKTQAEFFESISGADGVDGTNGQSAYELWLAQAGNEGKTEQEFLESLEGKSAYETYLTLPGNAGKTEQDFIDSLKGLTGEQGKSAYQIWLDAGNSGSQTAFLESLKGEPGDDGVNGTNGTNGTDGKDGTGVNILATVTQEDFDQIVADNASAVGDGYIVDEFFYIYNGTDWVKSNSLMGPEGKGLNYLGTWPTGTPLPLDANYKAGDTYVWGAAAGNISLWTLVEAPERKWVDIGVPGPQGKSAYQTWLDLGNVGNEAAFIASLKGTKGDTGDTGPQGKSAYQVWVDAGNVGTVEQFLTSLEGQSAYQLWLTVPGNEGKTEAEFLASLKGAKGDPAVAFEIMGQLTDAAQLPRPGAATEAYYVNKDLFVWITDQNDYVNLGSLDGASAYQIWLSLGNSGTEADFIASLKGTDGTNGTNGTDGENLKVLGRLADEATIKALPTPAEQDAYIADDTDHLWIYSNAAWFDAGKFGGEDGTNGTNGKSAYQEWLDLGNTGTEQEFIDSLKGADGSDGKDLDLRGTKANAAEIQAIVAPVQNEAWVADDTGHLFIYKNTAWVDVGEFRGQDGTNGTNGTNGKSAYQIWLDAGNVGDEAAFIASLKGADGVGINPKGTVPDAAALNDIVNPELNDAYTTEDEGHLFVYNGTSWIDLGDLRGADGVQGVAGKSLNIVAEFALLADLPPASNYNEGDAVYIVEDGKLYQVNAAGTYNPGIYIRGEQGEQGVDGPQGPAGTSISIMGSYADEAALIAAHPTGNPGEGYLIGPDLYIYGVNPTGGATEWYNVGPVRGPEGPIGKDGPRGLRGFTGETGQRGSLWLTLPEGVDTPASNYGIVGDWAVNSQFDSFYKDPTAGWVLIGRLVAGDVNSPLPSLGKVVREGNQWVALPVDEVENPVEGTFYGRVGQSDGTTDWAAANFTKPVTSPVNGKQYVMLGKNDGTADWAEITIPAAGVPEVPANTTVPQGRTSAGWTAVMAVPTGQDATKRYELKAGAWVTSAIQADAPSTAATPLCYQVDASGVGSWVKVSFDAYTLKQDSAAKTANFAPDMLTQQTFRVSASGASPVQVTLPNLTGSPRTMLAVFVVDGNAQKMTFAAASGASVAYNNGVAAADIEYGAVQTVLTAFWNGFGTWIVSKGPSY